MIVQNPSFKKTINHAFFNPLEKSNLNFQVLLGGRGGTYLVNSNQQTCVLKKYLRGGLMAKISYDSYLWLGLKQSRVEQERNIIQYLTENKFITPQFVAFQIIQTGLLYQQSMITQFVKNKGSLESILDQQELSETQIINLAKTLKVMHQLKVNHADLNANNILLDENEHWIIIDFDKAKIMQEDGHWKNQNLQRLKRSLEKLSPSFYSPLFWNNLDTAYSK